MIASKLINTISYIVSCVAQLIGFQLKYKKNMHRFNKNIVPVHTNTVNENKISHMSTLV